MLRDLGCEIRLADNGREALNAMRTQAFDLVLMDCQMPVLDGIEATRRIRALERGARVPIVALTANAFGADRDACLAAGMDDFIAKPFKTPELVATLERWLAARSAA
jgi:CheY-like chemotaxis protein